MAQKIKDNENITNMTYTYLVCFIRDAAHWRLVYF